MSSRARLRIAVAVTLVAAAATATATSRFSDAAFTAKKTNPNNSFTAANSFERMRVASGSYTGSGADNRNIAVPFQPDLVIVKGNTAQTAVARSSTMSGDTSKPLGGATALSANMIQALQATGFQVGTQARVNSNGVAYSWVALSKAQGTLSVGSYAGTGVAGRTITGLGYSPDAVMVLGATAVAPVLRIAGMSTGFAFDTGTGVASSISSLDSDGFTVGNSTSTNSLGATYHYISFNEVPGLVDVGAYTGNGTSQGITGPGFSPALVIARSSSTSTSRAGTWRPSALTGTSSLRFNAAVNDTNALTALPANGFTVGANVDANASANPYAYLALRDESP